MRGLITYFVFGSWWVAICAACMGLLTWYELTRTWWNAPIFVFILGSTLVIYNLNMISGLKELREMGTHSERHHWCMANELTMKVTLAIGLLLSAISVWFLNPIIWLLMIPLGLVALAYAAPIVRKNASKIRIREIGLWKVFIIAVVWAGMTAILPAVELLGWQQIETPHTWILAIERAVFILAITIPFDIRDLVNDAKKDVQTLPSVLTWQWAVVLSVFLIGVFITLLTFRLGLDGRFMGYAVSSIVAAVGLAFATPNRNDMYCSFWIEGTMLLQFFAVLLLA